MTTTEKKVFYPQHLYFTITLDGYWRFICVKELEIYAFYLDNNTAQELIKWLESGIIGEKILESEDEIMVLNPSFDNPLYWHVITEKPNKWRRRLGRGRVSLQEKEL